MRVRLSFIALREATQLPLDHQHAVASLIYSALGSGSTEFAANLHDVGFQSGGRTFKFFTFSRVLTHKAFRKGDNLVLEDPNIELQVGSPVNEFIEHLVAGLSRLESWQIANGRFRLAHTELIPPPRFAERMSFRALSPITESVRVAPDHPTFLSLADNWSEVIQRNLLRKYEALHGRTAEDQRLVWTWNKNYIDEAERRGKRLSVLRDIHGTKVRGWLAPFLVEGSRELIELGYEAGFGARNSMGFGMGEQVPRQKTPEYSA